MDAAGGDCEQPLLQAEAAAALCELASDGGNADWLASDEAGAALHALIVAEEASVAVPTAQLLLALARLAGAQRLFVEMGLLALVQQKLSSECLLCAVAQDMLGQVVCTLQTKGIGAAC